LTRNRKETTAKTVRTEDKSTGKGNGRGKREEQNGAKDKTLCHLGSLERGEKRGKWKKKEQGDNKEVGGRG